VVTAEGGESERRLVAHLVPNGAFVPEDLRGWMEHRLTPQMRPADFVTVENIPVMATGKVDRRALSAAYQTRAKLPNECTIEHGDATEGKLFALFNELFGDRHLIGRSDSFFHLGGNSLLAVRLLARIETELGANLSVHDLFTHPTIAGLAALIDQTEAKHEFLSLIKMNDGGDGPPLFIVHGWSGGVFHCLEFARRLEDERPVFGLQAVELAGRPRHRTVEEMAAHYAEELMRAHPGISYELFGHSLGGVIAYATACELLRRGERVTQLYVVDTLPPNLPRAVHVARVRAELRPRVLPHLRTMMRTWPRYWPRYLRARRSSLESRLRKWPSRANPESKPLRPDADYYHAVSREYVPPHSNLEVKLFTPSDRFPTEIYWRHLTSGRVTNYSLTSGHIDMFEGTNLDNFMAAFRQATADVHTPRSDSARPADTFHASDRSARNGHRDKTNG
ncbi:MAG: thioesterase domain-containing protein, partial [Chthoniobacterales bacterium]